MNVCPRCDSPGRAITRVTLEAQVLPDDLEPIRDRDRWRLCVSESCAVVYFCGDDVVALGQTRAAPFHKRDDRDRIVCFCFEHSVAQIEDDVRATGQSQITASIKAACQAGRDDCERKNPQGRCCLGNVGAVVRRAAPTTREPDLSCCSPKPVTTADSRSAEPRRAAGLTVPRRTLGSPEGTSAGLGLLASGGALVAAVLASACCWLPLVAIGFGASSAGLGAVFEAWRVPLLVLTAGALASSFWLVYRKPRCAPGQSCEVPNPRLRRFNRGMLWITTALVAAFALFPEYVGAFSQAEQEAASTSTQTTVVRYQIEGMTCAGCEGIAQQAIEALPGVASAAVSYRKRSAEVTWSDEPDHAALATAVSELGYRVTPAP